MTRLTNVFSKKAGNHAQIITTYFMRYNSVAIHLTVKVTPASGERHFKALGNIRYGGSIGGMRSSKREKVRCATLKPLAR